MKVVIYGRVSTNLQDYNRQLKELNEFSALKGYQVVGEFAEQISGSKKNFERPELMDMISFIKKNRIGKVLCWEISRLGRNSLEVLKTIELLNKNNISLYIKNFNIETLDDNRKTNPLSTFMIQILSSIAEMESSQIRARMKSGYDNYRSNGGKVGRKEGYKKSDAEILDQYKDVVKELKRGTSIRRTMKLTDRSMGTVVKVKRIIEKAA